MEILFISSFSAGSAKFSQVDAGNVVLFQIKDFGKYIKETTPARYFIEVTVCPIFTLLRVIRRKNRIHWILKWKICYKDLVLSPSYLNLLLVTDIQQVLKMWKLRNLTLEGKIVIFKTIAISTINFQSFITTAPKHIVNKLEKIQNTFLWKNSWGKKWNPLEWIESWRVKKWRHSKQNHSSSMFLDKKTYCFHKWKLIPLYLTEKLWAISFRFHSNLVFKWNKTKFFPSFYREIILNWKKHLAMMIEIFVLAFCLNICGTIGVSTWIKPQFNI